MFTINVIAIFCVYFIVYSESAFCCAKYKYVTDTHGVNTKKCVLSVLCPRERRNVADNQNNGIEDENYIETHQNYLKSLKQYADQYQITDKRYQNYVKNYENFVKDLQNYATGSKTSDEYTSIVNKLQQLDNEYENYIKGYQDYVEVHQNYLKEIKQYADKYQITDKRYQNYVKNYENFVKDLQNYAAGSKTPEEYTNILNKFQQLTDEYNNYFEEFINYNEIEEILQGLNNETINKNNDTNHENYVKIHQNYLKRLKQYADKYQITDERYQNFVKNYENFIKDLQNYAISKTSDNYASIINKFEQIENYIKELRNHDAFNKIRNVRRKRSIDSEEYSNNEKISPEAAAFEKCYWKYKKFGARVCYQAKLQLYSQKLMQMFPFLDKEKSDKIDEKYEMMEAKQNALNEVGSGMDDKNNEDNNINVLLTSDGKIPGQKKNRIDSMLTAAPNCFEGSGSLAHNNLCRVEFFDY